ncbi:MAG: hypothetical protein DMF20_03065 [Verrucomicrobia bacterium]|nr:MAG: hypothetical protein DMF20_03065 [Verrucomicrobiota bacterium]
MSGPLASAEESGWLTDYKQAQQQAKANNKILLLDFTGSDWCGWCKKFDREVLLKPEFKDFARDNLVVVELDFPRGKPQTAELRKQNRYPGYFPDGPAAFIAELQKLRKG